jgi:hypothetical protein
MSHPALRHADAPERIDVVLVNGDPNPNGAEEFRSRRTAETAK